MKIVLIATLVTLIILVFMGAVADRASCEQKYAEFQTRYSFGCQIYFWNIDGGKWIPVENIIFNGDYLLK